MSDESKVEVLKNELINSKAKELLEIYNKNFPNNIREENTVKSILNNSSNHIIEKRNDSGKLIGVSVINESTIIMLCVDKEYRKKGIGTKLLEQSENYILNEGYNKLNIGVGYNYLMPGIPINKTNLSFFGKRYYIHSWKDVECFDMDMELKDFNYMEYKIGDTINDVYFRWATHDDVDEIVNCADDACQYQDEKFSKFYLDSKLYEEGNNQRVLIAVKNNRVVGCIMVSLETEGKDIGSVGCTCVRYAQSHQKIGTNMVMIGTRYLKDMGLKYGHLGYTYSGLDKMYGYSGYKISTKYLMAEKQLIKTKDSDFVFRRL